MAIDEIRQNLSGAAVSTIVSSLFSVFNLALLFYYDVRLGLLALLLAVITIAVMVFASYRQLKYQRPLAALQGRSPAWCSSSSRGSPSCASRPRSRAPSRSGRAPSPRRNA